MIEQFINLSHGIFVTAMGVFVLLVAYRIWTEKW